MVQTTLDIDTSFELKTRVICKLYDIGAVKFGKFVLKSGVESPVYIDLRIIPSFPELFLDLISLLIHVGEQNQLFTALNHENQQLFLCGVPYSALTFASVVAAQKSLPSIIVRKEQKTYGTKNMVEGKYEANDRVLIIEDVMTSGASILETVEKIEAEKLQVEHAIVFLNRQQSGTGLQFDLPAPSNGAKLNKPHYPVTACVTLDEVVSVLLTEQKIDAQTAETIRNYVSQNQFQTSSSSSSASETTKQVETPKELSFEERAKLAKTNAFSKQLFELMAEKKTNLCLSADVSDPVQLINIIEQVGDEICLLKTHMDIVQLTGSPFTSYEQLIQRIVELSEKHRFLIFEDRKFADIGNTVQHQYEHGPFSICKWAHLTNTHLVSGLSSVKALQQSAQKYIAAQKELNSATATRGCLVIAEMSTQDSLYSKPEFKQYFLKLSEQSAEECPDFVSGFICQGRFIKETEKSAHLLFCTPGVNIDSSADGLGQVYNSPEHVVSELKSDVIIVGRGIYHSQNPQKSAQEFRQRAWSAYEKRLQQ